MNIQQIVASKSFVMSAEVFPPKRGGMLEGVIRALKEIKQLEPDFVSITYGANGKGGDTTADVASVAIDAFDMTTVAHMTAVNMTIAGLEEKLEQLSRKGVENILTLRGDIVDDSEFYDFRHASDLAAYIKKHYPQFHLIGACYPEGHYQAPSLEADIDNLKRKLDAGVEHLITQLFFDNSCFYRFRDLLASKGIDTPVSAGIMPITNAVQVSRTVAMSGAHIPPEFAKVVANNDGPQLYDAGIAYAVGQIRDLHDNGVRGIHLYTMNKGDVARQVFTQCQDLRE